MIFRILIVFFISLLELGQVYGQLAGNIRRKQRLIQKNSKFLLKTSDHYSYESCQKYNSENNSDYYFLSCDDQKLNIGTNLNELSSQVNKVNIQLYQDKVINDIQKTITNELSQNLHETTTIINCIENPTSNSHCNSIIDHLLSTLPDQLTNLRALMAQMDRPGLLFSSTKYIRYNEEFEHPQSGITPKPLSEKEKKQIELVTDQFEAEFTKQFREENKHEKELLAPRIAHGVAAKFNELNKNLKKTYEQTINQNPILSYLKINGEESKEEILDDIKNALTTINADIKKELNSIKSLLPEEKITLLKYDKAINTYINTNGGSKLSCDVIQKLKNKFDSEDLNTDLLIGAAALAGGGACVFTGGILCSVAVIGVTEAANLIIANKKHTEAISSFNAGLGYNSKIQDTQDNLVLTAALIPTAFVGGNYFTRLSKAAFQTSAPTKKVVIDQYLHSFQKTNPIGEAQNLKWINQANNNSSDLYLDIENAAIKQLNDRLGDKNLVTAVTNMHKDLLHKNMNEILKKYPDIKVEIYSDFKSMRYAFKSTKSPPEIPKELIAEINNTFEKTNNEFAKKVSSIKGLENEAPAKWFQGGLGRTADEAGLSAKKSRSLNYERTNNNLTDFEEAKAILIQDVKKIDQYSYTLSNPSHPLANANLIENIPGTDQNTLKLTVFETLRKVPTPTKKEIQKVITQYKDTNLSNANAHKIAISKTVQKTMKDKYGIDLTDDQAYEMFEYGKTLDNLTPGLRSAKRVVANLDDADFGGLSGDITGMGARNTKQVALDIAQSNNRDPEKILTQIRNGESNVTNTFSQIKNNFNQVVEETLEARGVKLNKQKCSGDDCIAIPTKELSEQDQHAIIKAFSNQENPSQYRMSFIPQGVVKEHRSELAVHGELIEKNLRKLLTGTGKDRIPEETLSQITIATKMPQKINQGEIKILISPNEKVQLTKNQIEHLEAAIKKSIKKTNKDLLEEQPNNQYLYTNGGTDWIK